jgi:thiol:disulfide interchange protein
MSRSAYGPRLRSLIGRTLYFVGGPVLGLPLFFVALFLGSTGPPSWKWTVLGALAGYVGLWLALLESQSSRINRRFLTSVLLLLGLLSIAPYAAQVSQLLFHPPLSSNDVVILVLFWAPAAVAAQYLIASLWFWRRGPVVSGEKEPIDAAP